MGKEKIIIIIPSYNEEERIEKTLNKYVSFFKKKHSNFEIIIVINNTTDQSPKIIKNLGKKYKEIKILEFKERGKGFAIVEGFKEALKRKGDLIGFVDADMATPPEAFYDLEKKLENAQGAIASRWMKKSIIKTEQSFMRKFVSRGFNLIVKTLFLINYKDTQCGAKLFTKKVIKKILPEIKLTEWAFDVNILYLCKRYKFAIKEIPTIWSEPGGTKLNLKKVPLQMFLSILRLRLIYSPFEKISKPFRPLVGLIYKIAK